jgi:glycosidase
MSPRSCKDLDFRPYGEVTPSPTEWRDQVFYQLLIDRFDNNQDHPPFDPDSSNRHEWDTGHAKKFQGGRIAGITRRLDYLRNLGCTALWISPPFKNRAESGESYHGYGIQNFLAVDPRFGTLEDLRELVRQAHQRRMYVVLDVVINHTGDNWGYVDDSQPKFDNGRRYEFGFWRAGDGTAFKGPREGLSEDDAVWPVEFQNPEFYKRKGQIGDMATDSPDEVVDGDTGRMKDLDLTREDVLDAIIRCHKWWIAQTDCDGFRIDTMKHIEPHAASMFLNSIREFSQSIGKHNFQMFAEIVAEDEMLMKYLGQNTPEEDEPKQDYPALCSCLDFPLCFVLEAVIKSQSPPSVLKERYERFQRFYRDYGQVGNYFVTFFDSHDQIHRPYFRFMHGETDCRLTVLAVGYLLTSMGIPCIYYGTEQCFNGGSDEDDDFVRETMFGGEWGAFGAREGHFFNQQHPTYQAIAAITRLRATEPTLRYGRQYFCQISQDGQTFGDSDQPGGVFAYTRVLDTTSVVIVMNLANEPQASFVSLDGKFFHEGAEVANLLSEDRFTVQTAPDGKTPCVHLQLEPRQIVIFKVI